MKRSFILVSAMLLWLAGCSSVRTVDSDVQTFSALPAAQALAAGSTYRFERLPSQQAHGEQQAQIEAMAEAALARFGLQRNETAPTYDAQVSARAQREIRYSPDPWWPAWGPYWRPRGPMAWPYTYPSYAETRLYLHEVSIVLRLRASGKVVYETHAMHDGVWADSVALWPVMFEAALSGFPTPPAGMRRVNIDIPR